ncbi:MAG: site-specific DNA-methyltransferase [Candidatus Pacebacteria bacterium]|nr:site-specific DNA-methyltransferase [Candidatus Paceibacterota bacterium]
MTVFLASNHLYCGDNLALLQRIERETVDLVYLDPPFYSQRNYLISMGSAAKTQAFSDVWQWDGAAMEGWSQISDSRHPAVTELLRGLRAGIGANGLLAYLVSLSLRIMAAHSLLKPTGSFYLHCDPSASHYLKLLCDMVFCGDQNRGLFLNEIIWHYQTGGASKRHYAQKHDVILFYAASSDYHFCPDEIREPRSAKSLLRAQNPKGARIAADNGDKLPTDVFAIPALNPMSRERLGYPTQKPEALLERLIRASSRSGDLVLDPYCGSGTTVAVAARLGRRWLGIDSNPAAVELARQRLESQREAPA